MALLVWTGASGARADLKAQVGDIVQPYLKGKKGVGVVVGVLTPTSRQVFGFGRVALRGGERTPDGKTVFEIGSVTKVFTALLLADMARRGEVKREDPVRRYLPKEAKVPRRGGREITLLHLATHTSGLPRMPPGFEWYMRLLPEKDRDNPYRPFDAKLLYGTLSVCQLDRDVGSAEDYSNLGMGLLGHALARRAGKPYEELVVERVAKPLGMPDTCVTLSAGQRARLAPPHDGSGKPTPAWDFLTLKGAGALRSTADDLLVFLAAQRAGKKTPLAPAIADAQKRHTIPGGKDLRLPLGWQTETLEGTKHEVFWHNGGTGGTHSYLGFVPQAGTAVVVLCNSQQVGFDVDRIGTKVLRLLSKPEARGSKSK